MTTTAKHTFTKEQYAILAGHREAFQTTDALPVRKGILKEAIEQFSRLEAGDVSASQKKKFHKVCRYHLLEVITSQSLHSSTSGAGCKTMPDGNNVAFVQF